MSLSRSSRPLMSADIPPRGYSGPTLLGTYLDPPRVVGLDLDDLPDEPRQTALADRGTQVAWHGNLDGVVVMLTHAGGIFVEFPKAWASEDPVEQMNGQRHRAADLINVVLCEPRCPAPPMRRPSARSTLPPRCGMAIACPCGQPRDPMPRRRLLSKKQS